MRRSMVALAVMSVLPALAGAQGRWLAKARRHLPQGGDIQYIRGTRGFGLFQNK